MTTTHSTTADHVFAIHLDADTDDPARTSSIAAALLVTLDLADPEATAVCEARDGNRYEVVVRTGRDRDRTVRVGPFGQDGDPVATAGRDRVIVTTPDGAALVMQAVTLADLARISSEALAWL